MSDPSLPVRFRVENAVDYFTCKRCPQRSRGKGFRYPCGIRCDAKTIGGVLLWLKNHTHEFTDGPFELYARLIGPHKVNTRTAEQIWNDYLAACLLRDAGVKHD